MSVNKDYTENASPKIPQAPDVWTILKQGRIFNNHQTICLSQISNATHRDFNHVSYFLSKHWIQ